MTASIVTAVTLHYKAKAAVLLITKSTLVTESYATHKTAIFEA